MSDPSASGGNANNTGYYSNFEGQGEFTGYYANHAPSTYTLPNQLRQTLRDAYAQPSSSYSGQSSSGPIATVRDACAQPNSSYAGQSSSGPIATEYLKCKIGVNSGLSVKDVEDIVAGAVQQYSLNAEHILVLEDHENDVYIYASSEERTKSLLLYLRTMYHTVKGMLFKPYLVEPTVITQAILEGLFYKSDPRSNTAGGGEERQEIAQQDPYLVADGRAHRGGAGNTRRGQPRLDQPAVVRRPDNSNNQGRGSRR
ncbi:hypothetical protein HD806DRAFT_89058 [Xylariaceae sp. AK1471]|nr:hypothetical protein HD806DRAFT_89058 [Xylariaceae sp. AK1471]